MLRARRTRTLIFGFIALLAVRSQAAAQSAFPTPRPVPTPNALPVIFESDDARDGLYEAGTDAIAQTHFAKGVPLSQLTVPCGPGSTLSPFNCVTTTYHQRYAGWIAQYPGLFEVGQHGITHTEQLGTMSAASQLDLINRALQVMQGWGLPGGRPFTFAPPFASENADTIAALEQLGFQVSIRDSDSCLPTSLTRFCESVSLCARDANGNRVAGPSCVLLPAATLIAQVNERQYDGRVFLAYHSQDLMLSDLKTVDTNKIAAFGQILQAFKNEEAAGHYRLMTFKGYHDAPPAPTPTPGADFVVFDDFLAAPWSNSSWSATVDLANTTPVFSGTRSIAVAETGWGALSLESGNWNDVILVDPTRYQGLELQVYASGTGFNLGVQLEDDKGNPFPPVVTAIPANQWTSLSLSMTALDPSARPFDHVDVFDNDGKNRTYYVDGVRFLGKRAGGSTPSPTVTPTRTPTIRPTATPPPGPTPTATPQPPTPTATPQSPPTPTPTGAASTIVYADALASPWVNASWSSTVSFANASPVFSGTSSIRVDETGWGAFSVHSGSWTQTQHRNPSLYSSVQFRVYTTTSGFNVAVRFEDDSRTSFPEVAIGAIPANQWVLVSVPITQLDPAGIPFDRLDVRDYGGVTRTYFIDDLQLVNR